MGGEEDDPEDAERDDEDRRFLVRLPLMLDDEAGLFDGAAQGVAEGIRTMVVRGAPAIGVAAAYGVALEGAATSIRSISSIDAATDKS